MHAETMAVEKAPLSEKTKRRAACQPEIRMQREQASESMCECAMGEVRCLGQSHDEETLTTMESIDDPPATTSERARE